MHIVFGIVTVIDDEFGFYHTVYDEYFNTVEEANAMAKKLCAENEFVDDEPSGRKFADGREEWTGEGEGDSMKVVTVTVHRLYPPGTGIVVDKSLLKSSPIKPIKGQTTPIYKKEKGAKAMTGTVNRLPPSVAAGKKQQLKKKAVKNVNKKRAVSKKKTTAIQSKKKPAKQVPPKKKH